MVSLYSEKFKFQDYCFALHNLSAAFCAKFSADPKNVITAVMKTVNYLCSYLAVQPFKSIFAEK